MKVIIINTVYGEGSTGKLTLSFCKYLESIGDIPLAIFGAGRVSGDSCAMKIGGIVEQKIHNFLGRLTGLNSCFSWNATYKIIKEIKFFEPDVVFLGNLHGHYIDIFALYRFLKKYKIPCIQIMWDEYPMTGTCSFSYDCEKFKGHCNNCSHLRDYPISWFFDTSGFIQKKKRIAYDNDFLAFVGVPYTIQRAKESFLLQDKKLFALDEAVDQINRYYPRNVSKLKADLGIPSSNKVIIDVCVFTSSRKGGRHFLNLAWLCKDIKDMTFVHVGYNGDPLLCPSNYIPIPFVTDQDLMPYYYSLGDIFVCTSEAETQPNTCLEALSCGTPICGFNVSGIPTCADFPYGKYVPYGDIEGLKDIIVNTDRKNDEIIHSVRRYAESRFSINDYYYRLRKIALNLIKSKKRK